MNLQDFITSHDAEDAAVVEKNNQLLSENAAQAQAVAQLQTDVNAARSAQAAAEKALAEYKATHPEVTNDPEPPPVEEVPGWKADLVDNFDSINTATWGVKNNTYADNENSYLLAKNVSANGTLRIQGKLESVGGRAYTSGYITSQGKYTLPNYFRAEVRARCPFEQGMWAAPLWFRPADGQGGELDLVETYGKYKGKFNQTLHTEYGANHQQLSRSYAFASDPLGWHTYTIEKVKGKTTMYMDGKVYLVVTSASPSDKFNAVGWYDRLYEQTARRWDLRVNLQIGGSWGGLPDSTTDWSPDKTSMEIDYIKTWVPA